MQFTGKRRYRIEKRLFKEDSVVLQVEVIKAFDYSCGGVIDIERKATWVDAKPEWLLEVGNNA